MSACFSCGKKLDFLASKVGFRDDCFHCSEDVHVCKNCDFYDESQHQQCREPSSEWVRDKEKRNYCEYFVLKKSAGDSGSDTKKDLMAAAEALFKK